MYYALIVISNLWRRDMQPNMDDIAAKLPNINSRGKKKNIQYVQKMQSRYGGNKFFLYTHELDNGQLRIELTEDDGTMIGTRNCGYGEQDIVRAIKSLEKKAGCKLYYVLLISTDGEYL
jgi:hypothetical protein